MWELVKAGGWIMFPMLVCSVISIAIMIERGIRLNVKRVAPPNLVYHIIKKLQKGPIDESELQQIQHDSALGRILATGIRHAGGGLDYMTDQMETKASIEIHQLEKYLTTLGTIGYIGPLLGLLGTVLGIIQAFLATSVNTTDPSILMTGISQALITTAFGIVVAVPAMIGYRYYQRKIQDLAVLMEEQSNTLVQALLGPQTAPYVKQNLKATEQIMQQQEA